jgi:hypothetical protein
MGILMEAGGCPLMYVSHLLTAVPPIICHWFITGNTPKAGAEIPTGSAVRSNPIVKDESNTETVAIPQPQRILTAPDNAHTDASHLGVRRHALHVSPNIGWNTKLAGISGTGIRAALGTGRCGHV